MSLQKFILEFFESSNTDFYQFLFFNNYVLKSKSDTDFLISKIKNKEHISFIGQLLEHHPANEFTAFIVDDIFNFYYENYDNIEDKAPWKRHIQRFSGYDLFEKKLLERIDRNHGQLELIFEEFKDLDKIYFNTFHSLGAKSIFWKRTANKYYQIECEIEGIHSQNVVEEIVLTKSDYLNLIKYRISYLANIFLTNYMDNQHLNLFSEMILRNKRFIQKYEDYKIDSLFEKYNFHFDLSENLLLKHILDCSHIFIVYHPKKIFKDQEIKDIELTSNYKNYILMIENSFQTREELIVDIEIMVNNNLPKEARIINIEPCNNDSMKRRILDGNQIQ